MQNKGKVLAVNVTESGSGSSSSNSKKKKQPPRVHRGHPLWHILKREHVPAVNRGLSQKGTKTIEAGTFITMTPINILRPSTEFSVMAKNDYIVEEHKFYQGEDFPKWDDPGRDKAHTGEMFAFCHNQLAAGKDIAEFFYVTGKKPSSERPKNWLVPVHKDRDVILLSRYVGYTRLTDLMYAVGLRKSVDIGVNCLRGTIRRRFKVDFEINLE